MLTEITSNNFQEFTTQNSRTLIEFGAEWCGPCRMTLPNLVKLQADREDIEVGKVDVDLSQDLASQYSVTNVPTMLLIENGEVVKRQVGALSYGSLEKFIES